MAAPLTLEMMAPGTRARVVAVYAPGRWRQRLLQMGVVPGAVIEVVVNNRVGPILIRVMGVTLSIGRGIARRIIVQPIP